LTDQVPDYGHLIIDKQLHRDRIAIFYVEGSEAGLIKDKSNPYLHRRDLAWLAEQWLQDRNGFYFLRHSTKEQQQKGKKGRYDFLWIKGRNSIWLPIKCCKTEIDIAISKQKDYSYARIARKPVPSKAGDKGRDYFLKKMKEKLGNGDWYFYGIREWKPNGVPPEKHCLKIGITSDLERRLNGRKGFNNYHIDSETTLRWAIPLSSEDDGKAVEEIFEQSFGSHCARWSESERFLLEYFMYDDVISSLADELQMAYPSPLNSPQRKSTRSKVK
jgi:hypothetical protein